MLKRMTARTQLFILCSILFIFLLPCALQINFLQNDEWAHYGVLNSFLKGDFTLHPVIAPTFYAVGVLALAWARVFGVDTVPVLTLLVSVGCFFMLARILMDFYNKPLGFSVLLSSLLFVNPLFVFTSWGFMTDNYFLFFLLLSIYFLLGYKKNTHFLLGNFFIVVSYFARQLGIVTSLAFGIYLVLQREYRKASAQIMAFLLLVSYHFLFFPKTSEMLETKFEFSSLFYVRFVYSFIFIVGIYLVFFLFPLVLLNLFDLGRKKLSLVVCVSLLLAFLGGLYFKPTIRWRNDFPFLTYTFQQNGFFTENLHGKKLPGVIDDGFYKTADLVSRIFVVAFVIKSLACKARKIEFSVIYLIVYISLLIISAKVYDRYLIPLVAFSILYFATNLPVKKYTAVVIGAYALAMGFYSYNFETDYFLTNKYVWNRSKELVSAGVTENQITSTDAWRYLYPRSEELYKFTYDAPDKGAYNKEFVLIESKSIEYPLTFWRSNRIYLYKKLGVEEERKVTTNLSAPD